MRRMTFLAPLLAASVGAQAVNAQQPAAFWSRIDKTMSDLLTEGWKISSHTEYVYGQGKVDYSFVLSKDNKAVICFVDDPSANRGTTSVCRALN